MRFVLATSITPAADIVAETLMAHLAQGPVLWLLSGGSCIPVAVAAADRLRATGISLEHLTVSLVDERYGAVDHPDSNWGQLIAAGLNLPGAQLQPILTAGVPAEETAAAFAAFLDRRLGLQYTLALLGIGPDGHTSGIKPHSPALNASGYVSEYGWDDYHRITTTAKALARVNEAIVYALGEAKWPVIAGLKHSADPAEQPAQLLKSIPQLTIVTDQPQAMA